MVVSDRAVIGVTLASFVSLALPGATGPAFASDYRPRRQRRPSTEPSSRDRRRVTSRAVYGMTQHLRMDLINALAFRNLQHAQRAGLVPSGVARDLLQIKSLAQIKSELDLFQEQLLLPAATSGHLSEKLHREALDVIARGVASTGDSGAARVARGAEADRSRQQESPGVADVQPRRASQAGPHLGGRIAHVPMAGEYRLYSGRYRHKRIGPLTVPVLTRVPLTFKTRWAVRRFLHWQLDGEYGHRVQTARDIQALEAVTARLEKLGHQQLLLWPDSRAARPSAPILDLLNLATVLGSNTIVERELAQKAVLSAAVLAHQRHVGSALVQLGLASTWLRQRLSAEDSMIANLKQTRGDLRVFTDRELSWLTQKLQWAENTSPFTHHRRIYPAGLADKCAGNLRACAMRLQRSQEPDLVAVAPKASRALESFEQWAATWRRSRRIPLSSDQRASYRDKLKLQYRQAQKAFWELRRRVRQAIELNRFIARYEDLFADRVLAGVEKQRAQARAFHDAVDRFFAEQKRMRRNLASGELSPAYHAWWLMFYPGVYVSAEADNPARSDPSIDRQLRKQLPKRIPNPVLSAFDLYFEMAQHNAVEAILADDSLAGRFQTPNAEPPTQLKRLVDDMAASGRRRLYRTYSGDKLALTQNERTRLEEALAALPYRMDPLEVARAVGLDATDQPQLEQLLAALPEYRIDPSELARAHLLQQRPTSGVKHPGKPRIQPIQAP